MGFPLADPSPTFTGRSCDADARAASHAASVPTPSTGISAKAIHNDRDGRNGRAGLRLMGGLSVGGVGAAAMSAAKTVNRNTPLRGVK
ncbi:hypothetical protein GCM10010341_31600 [Streptomyces noursei]|nr:hypothetical protein GCM10010341_31600 [Streptomyces noursei]